MSVYDKKGVRLFNGCYYTVFWQTPKSADVRREKIKDVATGTGAVG
jgi:hypothetical protein